MKKDFCGFPLYQRIDRKNLSRGRADLDDRTKVCDKTIKTALKAPRRVGIIISIIFLLITMGLVFQAGLSGNFWYLSPLLITTYFIIFGLLTAAGSYYGVKTDVYLMNHLEEYKNEVTWELF